MRHSEAKVLMLLYIKLIIGKQCNQICDKVSEQQEIKQTRSQRGREREEGIFNINIAQTKFEYNLAYKQQDQDDDDV